MTKEEKIEKIKELVKEYNTRHFFTVGNEDNAGRADYYEFNSTEMVDQINADSNEPVTLDDMGFEPDTDYYELELYKYRKLCEVEKESIIDGDDASKFPDGDWYVLEADKQYITKDFNYFYKQATNVLNK